MDSKSPTNNDAENDADPPDLTKIEYFSPNYSLIHSNEIDGTVGTLETTLIYVAFDKKPDDSTGSDLGDFVLGLYLTQSTNRTLEFGLLPDTTRANQIAEQQIYSQSKYSDAQQTRVNPTPIHELIESY